MPVISSGATVWTFADAVEHLLDLHELDTRTPVHERRARSSILHAYRELATCHTWNYYYRTYLLQTVADQTSSTITYDHTGGAAERLLTIAAGTWPSWAAYGRIIIDDVHYEVDTRESSTTLTLKSDSNPGEDVAAGTSYTLYRSAYPLPANYATLCRVWDITDERALNLIDPSQFQAGNISFYDTPNDPWEAMVRSTGEYYSGMALHFGPPPTSARTYEILYRVHPRPLAIDEYNAGTVSVSSGSATVTGSGTTFPTNCAGSIIRFSSTSNQPSSLVGSLSGSDNPFVMQSVIKSRDSATQLTLEENATVTISSGSGYVISDPIDIDTNRMYSAFIRLAEAEFCMKAERKDADKRSAMARIEVLKAMAADAPYDNVGDRAGRYDPFTRTTANE